MNDAHAPVATCTSCCASEVRECTVRSAFWEDERLVVVEDIPAFVCEACGERFYDDTTVMVLDLLRGEGFREENSSGTIRVPVFSFRDRVTRREEA